MSRYIAISAIGLWLTSYVLGVGVLNSDARNRKLSFDELLETGLRQWAVRDRITHSCIGALESNFTTDKKPELSLVGSVTVLVYGHPTPISFRFHSKFTSYYKLEAITANVRAGQASLSVSSDSGDSANLRVAVSAPDNYRSVSLRRPEPIYLIERQSGQFSIRFPRSVQALLESRSEPSTNISSIVGMEVTPLSEEQRSQCAVESALLESHTNMPSGIIDLGRILELLRITPTQPGLEALVRRDT